MVDSLAVVTCGTSRRYAPFIVLGIGALGMAYGRNHIGNLPFAIPAALSACLFFAAGMFLRRFRQGTIASAPTLSGFSLLTWVGLTDLSPEGVDMAAKFFGADPWIPGNVAAAFAGSHLLLVLVRAVARLDRPLTAFVGFLGANTLPIVGFNYWVNSLAVENLGNWFVYHWAVLFIVEMVFFVVLLRMTPLAGTAGRVISGKWSPASA